jgi:DNA modification methylase
MDISSDLHNLLSGIGKLSIDRRTIPQMRLDLVNRDRTSLFPWRGQFSPGLVELLLEYYACDNYTVFDPFVGSGTTLFEAGRKSLSCFGTEINPAALEMAKTAEFINMDKKERFRCIHKAENILKKHLPSHLKLDHFLLNKIQSGRKIPDKSTTMSMAQTTLNMLHDAFDDEPVRNIIANTILGYACLENEVVPEVLLNAFKNLEQIIERLPYSRNPCKAIHCDARHTPLDKESVDLVITSPPYINVFNYHQNYRKVMETMGWDLLAIARSEIGSNRKNRANRFLTVIQYAIDMLQALCEMRRTIRPEGKIIIIIGRKSKVCNVEFENYKILSALAVGGASLRLTCRQERKFINRFGKPITEDLLHFTPAEDFQEANIDFARAVGVHFLAEAEKKAAGDKYDQILSAIDRADTVPSSALFIKQDITASLVAQ